MYTCHSLCPYVCVGIYISGVFHELLTYANFMNIGPSATVEMRPVIKDTSTTSGCAFVNPLMNPNISIKLSKDVVAKQDGDNKEGKRMSFVNPLMKTSLRIKLSKDGVAVQDGDNKEGKRIANP